jgi:hypothetical protein
MFTRFRASDRSRLLHLPTHESGRERESRLSTPGAQRLPRTAVDRNAYRRWTRLGQHRNSATTRSCRPELTSLKG